MSGGSWECVGQAILMRASERMERGGSLPWQGVDPHEGRPGPKAARAVSAVGRSPFLKTLRATFRDKTVHLVLDSAKNSSCQDPTTLSGEPPRTRFAVFTAALPQPEQCRTAKEVALRKDDSQPGGYPTRHRMLSGLPDSCPRGNSVLLGPLPLRTGKDYGAFI